MKKIVYLVDNKNRDLPSVVLLTYHLEKLGIECIIEPLEAWKGCLYAHKPDMIIFNHLLGSHLVEYSRFLNTVGVLVGVLPNEGILYNKEVLDFNSSKFHNGAHIDYFFVWNQAHKDAILKGLNTSNTKVEIIGVPRFDFYFPPFIKEKEENDNTILICTNFVFSQFLHKDKSIADKLFSPWKNRISSYKDYWGLIKTNAKAKKMFFAFLNTIVEEKKYNIILKPHPGEDPSEYDRWYEKLDKDLKTKVIYDKTSYIWELIPKADLEIACETCTTTLESWIANKKTIELELTKNPVFYHEFISKMGPTCSDSSQIIDTIEKTLQTNISQEQVDLQTEHLAYWCDSPDGDSNLKLANILSKIDNPKTNFKNIPFTYKRKAKKLILLKELNLPYNYDPMLTLKEKLFPLKYKDKTRIYKKTIKPIHVEQWKHKISVLLGNQ